MRLGSEHGFTVIELVVVLSIISVMLLIAAPNFSEMKGQMSDSEDIRKLAFRLEELRAEAMRLKTNVRVNFASGEFSWDIYDDGSDDGTEFLNPKTNWQGGPTPADIVFNGLGLARGVGAIATISIVNRGRASSLTINANGHIEL